MVYRAISVVSGSSTTALNIAFTEFTETGGKWTFEPVISKVAEHPHGWHQALGGILDLPVLEYQQMHANYGKYIGEQVVEFIDVNNLHHQVHLVAVHGYMAAGFAGGSVLGHGAFVAAQTGLPVISDFGAINIAWGGNGTDLHPVAARLLQTPDPLAEYAETVVIALMGVLRWREEVNLFAAETAAIKDSVGGALWMGTGA